MQVTTTTLATVIPAAVAAELESLVKASKDTDSAVRRKAVDGLSSFLTNPDFLLRRQAAASLADLGVAAEPASAALRDAVKDSDTEVRKLARKALDNLEVAVAAAKAAITREAILALAKDLKAVDSPRRIKALQQIAANGSEANIVGEQLIEAMADKVPAVKTAASDALEKVNPKVHPHVTTLMFGMKKFDAVQQLEKLGTDAAIVVPLLLYYLDHPPSQAIGASNKITMPVSLGNLLKTISKIAPKDKRFASVVLASIAAPIPLSKAVKLNVIMAFPESHGARRLDAMALLDLIEADTPAKVKALTAALGDGQASKPEIISLIAALERFGKDAGPALPLLKRLKSSPNDEIRKAALEAVGNIE